MKSQILSLYLDGWTQQEIGEKYNLDKSQVSRILAELQNGTGAKIQLPEPQIGDSWRFTGCDDRYGLPGFPGRIPGQIVENLLHFYTEPRNRLIGQ